MSDTVFFHRDSYCKIELVPEQSAYNVGKDIAALKLPTKEVESLLAKHALVFFPVVNTGTSDHTTIKEDTVAYGFEMFGLFVESKQSVVTKLWLGFSVIFPSTNSCNNLLKVLQLIGREYQLILIDRDNDLSVRLQESNELEEYLVETFGFKL
ncbi:hypothetical protein [Chitinophaga silvisoli]|uniref:Uncharacterized protein n=1 Tax=Chitinophaga silvisoli TaxID=2291814 RepID=A0A3E1P9D7_9BACT|nr:hypothetical protein [Chitinophaga silvisoli]RFM36793.1 hypothetical protein DXN04_04650 [Chitinophaga silvisoli]